MGECNWATGDGYSSALSAPADEFKVTTDSLKATTREECLALVRAMTVVTGTLTDTSTDPDRTYGDDTPSVPNGATWESSTQDCWAEFKMDGRLVDSTGYE